MDKREINQTVSNIPNQWTVSAMFGDLESTVKAYNILKDKGYTDDEINIMMSDSTRNKYFGKEIGKKEIGTKALEGAGAGSAIGGAIGAAAGIIITLGTSILIPGLGIIVAGPLAAGLAGAGAGGITGGIIGALIGNGMTEERARIYESGIKKGKIVISVNPRNEEDARYLREELSKNKGEEIF